MVTTVIPLLILVNFLNRLAGSSAFRECYGKIFFFTFFCRYKVSALLMGRADWNVDYSNWRTEMKNHAPSENHGVVGPVRHPHRRHRHWASYMSGLCQIQQYERFLGLGRNCDLSSGRGPRSEALLVGRDN